MYKTHTCTCRKNKVEMIGFGYLKEASGSRVESVGIGQKEQEEVTLL